MFKKKDKKNLNNIFLHERPIFSGGNDSAMKQMWWKNTAGR
jgi:hypothetical protein